MNRNSFRLRVACSTIAAIMASLSIGFGSARAASPGPIWEVSPVSEPTNFTSGTSPAQTLLSYGIPQYYVNVTNVGTETTSGSITVTYRVPPGLTPIEPVVSYGGASEVPCPVVGETAECSLSSKIRPGSSFQVYVPVEVPAQASGVLTSRVLVNGGGAPASGVSLNTEVNSQSPGFGFLSGRSGVAASLFEPNGSALVQAGGHPEQLTVNLGFPSRENPGKGSTFLAGLAADGQVRDISVSLPKGVIVNPSGTAARCTEAQFEAVACPLASQVGVVSPTVIVTSVQQSTAALYNLVPPPGVAAEFGFEGLGLGILIHIYGGLRSDGSYELAASSRDLLARPGNAILGFQVQLWGNPADSSHDGARGECASTFSPCSQPAEPTTTPLLTSPTSCSSSLSLTAEADSWQHPGAFAAGNTVITNPAGEQAEVSGCKQLAFTPSISIQPESRQADSPTGINVDLRVPQPETRNTFAQAHLKTVRVTLPPNLVVNPSSASGLGGCSSAQMDLSSSDPGACPDESKIGSVALDTPLIEHALPGSVYVAAPYANPFGTLLALYLEVDDPQSGIVVKLPGRVDANPQSGQLTATFTENPQLPFEDLQVDFFGGPRAALRTPAICGQSAGTAELTPWSGTPPVKLSDRYEVTQGANGAPCASSEAELPARSYFEAGTKTPLAGSYSPFVLHLRREDGSQQFKALDLTLPPGLTGKLAGISYCSSAALQAAAGMTGREELSNPSCPSDSELGNVTVGAGAGPQPYYVSGKAYLTGPYKGAPLGLAIVTPAVAGPFDLGTVVVRSGLFVDPLTTQITVKSDELPHILQGIPLDIRDIRVEMGHPQFTLNPTSCKRFHLTGQAFTLPGQEVGLSDQFQVGGCEGLSFKPSLSISLKGSTKRTGHPALKAVVRFPKNQASANIARAQVNLPSSEFLDQGNIGKACTRVLLAQQACPAKSIYGKAKAWTPLLDEPLEGPVYLVGGFGYKLPALVAELNGQIRVLLVGKVDTGKNHGIRNTFESVPDAAVEKFVLEMKGGKKYGLLENSENLCAKKQVAGAAFKAQSGRKLQLSSKIATSCGKPKKAKAKERG